MWFFVAILQHCTVGKMRKKNNFKKNRILNPKFGFSQYFVSSILGPKSRFLVGKLNFLTLFRMKYSRKSSNFGAKIEFFKS